MMPINVVWKDETRTVLVFVYEGNWDLNDFYQATDKANSLLDEVTHQVNMVLDVRGSKMIPNGFMTALSNSYRNIHPNSGILVMVGINAFARAFIGLFRKVYPGKDSKKPIYFAGNYDEAQAIMDRQLMSKTV